MTAISLGQTTHRSRISRTATTGAIKSWVIAERYRRMSAQLREQFGVSDVTSRSQEFAGGFVDFLLGRGAHHPR
jgi:hypothetical protein